MPAIADLTHEYFAERVGQSFIAEADSETLILKVVTVTVLPPPRRRTLTGKIVDVPFKRAPFSVVFRSEGDRGLRQGSYPMQPPDGDDPILIFVVPLGFEDGGMIYEAVFT